MSEKGRKPSVVIIDHNQAEMQKLKTFLEGEAGCDVQTFTELAETERFFELNPVDVAISDCRVAQTNGLQLLKRLKEIQPESSRVLLTDCIDLTLAIQAINEVALFQYLEKPWNNNQMLLVVMSAAERSRLLRDLRQKIEQLDSAHSTLKTAQHRLIQAFM
jgi:DNA-binding NtrC family response regulator